MDKVLGIKDKGFDIWHKNNIHICINDVPICAELVPVVSVEELNKEIDKIENSIKENVSANGYELIILQRIRDWAVRLQSKKEAKKK